MLATAAATATAATATKATMLANATTKASNSMLMTTTSDTLTTTTTTRTKTTDAKAAPQSDTAATAMMPSITAATTTMPTTPITRTITTITSDPGILCFHHCNVKVFCFHLPHRCPKCKQVLDTGDDVGGNGDGGEDDEDEGEDDGDGDADDNDNGNGNDAGGNEMGSNGYNGTGGGYRPLGGGFVGSTRLLPFRLPYPFIRASQYPCAIVLRPTTGDFLNDYNNSTDLHIAVTTSTGCVVEFDRHGLRRHRADNTRMTEWWQCLLVGDVPEPWYDYWDEILQQICNQPDRWTVAHYQEDSHNCYTFVLAFLQALAYDKLSAAARSKTSFCEKYIVPRTTTAGKYISLYRKLRDTGIYVHPHHQHQRHAVHMKQQQKQQQQQHYYSLQQPKHQHQQLQQQRLKSARGKSRLNGYTTGSSTSSLLANGGKATSIILRAPNLCTIEE